MTDFTLKVTQMDCISPDDTVVRVHWAYTGTLGERSAGVGGVTDLVRDPLAPFTPFAQLTEEQVASWVQGAWSAEEKAERESAIESQLAVATPSLPWSA